GPPVATEERDTPMTPELETTPAEVKRYQRQKLWATVGSVVLNLTLLALLGLLAGPALDRAVRPWTGDSPWPRLVVLAFPYGVAVELPTLPLDFWSGFVLEHRYGLSNQTLGGWVWRKLKGYLVGAPIGLVLLFGLYALLWFGGPWWWLWAAAGWL